MTTKELNKILKDHALWLNGEDGKRADLRGANLRWALLQGANLQNAQLQGAKLQGAQLQGAQLQGALLQGAQLQGAQLKWAQLQGANLQGAQLQGANLQEAEANERTSGFWSVCPEEGSFTAFKKLADGKIAKLLIPEHAKRSSGTTRKCRCSEALVVEIKYKNGQSADIGYSRYEGQNGEKTMYTVGETVYPDGFDDDRWNECSNGIHFFMTREEAEVY